MFLRFALHRPPWNDPVHLPDYPQRCRFIDLELLSTRSLKLQRLVVFDVLTNNIDCSEFLLQIRINVPQRQMRYRTMISIPGYRTCYGYNNPLSSCLRGFNDVCDFFDFNMTKYSFKNRIKNVA